MLINCVKSIIIRRKREEIEADKGYKEIHKGYKEIHIKKGENGEERRERESS